MKHTCSDRHVAAASQLLWSGRPMRRLLPAVALLILIPALAAGQTTTDDGIRALLRGDYQSAVRILRPLADDVAAPDPVAQFFMAVLYQSGRGVDPDLLRACGLFLGATKPSNPLTQQASALANAMREQMGPGAQFCVSRGGPWGEQVPASFTLGPNHRVDMTASTIIVHYNGSEQRIMTSGGPGMVYLPAGYTPLQVSRPVAAHRHFLEQFIWWPDLPEKPSTWTLGWTLSEVVGGAYVPITGEPSLVMRSGSQPPTSFDVTSVARVRVNANGEAEWQIIGSANPRSGVIPWREPR
jgi:hypothetical protein